MDRERNQPSTGHGESRRQFLRKAAMTPVAASLIGLNPGEGAAPQGVRGERLRLIVSGENPTPSRQNEWGRFEVKSILDHEVAVLE